MKNKQTTDLHVHSTFSFDGKATPAEVFRQAYEKGIAFIGLTEHVDFDAVLSKTRTAPCIQKLPDAEAYFHDVRHLQYDYEGAMNVLVGVEIGYGNSPEVFRAIKAFLSEHKPDYVINSTHTINGWDYAEKVPFFSQNQQKTLRPRKEVYEEYLLTVLGSITQTEYDYDIISHLTYCSRYAPYEDKIMHYADHPELFDKILSAIIERDKILEVNTSNKGIGVDFIPEAGILKRYYELGGRKVSFGSDSHSPERLLDKREEVVEALLEIGFTYITVPFKGEHIKVKI